MPASKPAFNSAPVRRGKTAGDNLSTCATSAYQLLLEGRVQGHGVRPALARLADKLDLKGWVANRNDGVAVHIEGPAAAVADFCQTAASALPGGTELAYLHEQSVPLEHFQDFHIAPSEVGGTLMAQVPADLAICSECSAEVNNRLDRRAGYLLTSCAQCGPRYSLLQSMPYDRPETSLRSFQQCTRCASEFTNLEDRRFHSQINGCPECGPAVWLTLAQDPSTHRGARALELAVQVLRNHCILAMRGIGGYQLLVDATSEEAVRRLRVHKLRATKPLAVMVATLAMADQHAWLEDAERTTLADPTNPIVIVRRRCDAGIAAGVAQGLQTLGLLLPTTALHASIATAFGGPLVVTSGNRDGDPLEFVPADAERALAGIADAWLHHDRDIVRPIDDSVVRVIAGRRTTIRLARGFAPWPLPIESKQPLLAVGGHQKSAIALSNGGQAVLGPHIGDLDTEAARCRYVEHASSFCQLYNCNPRVLAHDLHPTYFSTDWAESAASARVAVQHHHAHVVAGMIEPHWLDRRVLGVAWDGTGYGADGTVWGGEFLVATAADFRRVGSLRAFFLPAGEIAIREPWRVALSLAYQAGGAELAASLQWATVPRHNIEQTIRMLQRAAPGVWTTSAGRLFDGVAALVLGLSESGYEGEPAMLLEAIANPLECKCYPLPVTNGEPRELDWRPMVRQLLVDRASGLAPADMAMKFHRALAQGIGAISDALAALPVVLAGGCFQNRVLTELVAERIDSNRPLALPGLIPVGDGGLAAGQLAVAAARLGGGRSSCA